MIESNAVFVNGVEIAEPYLSTETVMNDSGPYEVGVGEVFVMGDNRQFSLDSRRFGPIPMDDLIGKAFVTIWPLSNFGGL